MFFTKRPDEAIVFLLTASFVSASKISLFGIIDNYFAMPQNKFCNDTPSRIIR